MTRRILALCFVVPLICTGALPAAASWLFASAGTAYGKARSMPGGNTPSVSAMGRNVTVSWAKNTLPDGTDIQDYRVSRYNSSGVVQSMNSACDALVTGLSCTESGVTPGTWTYSVAPQHGKWMGADSPLSGSVDVAAPNLTFSSSTNITTLPATLTGDVSGFRAGAILTFRIDDPSTGTILTSTLTPNPIPNSGAASFSVAIPRGTSLGPHTVYATDGRGESAGADINVDVSAPTPTSFTTTNAGGNGGRGRIAQGDSFQVAFSQELDVGSMCSTWSGDTTNQAINGDDALTIRVNNNASLLGNDTMTIVAAPDTCGGTFNFGTVDLGGPGFVLGDATFGGAGALRSSLTWTPSTRTLSVTFGGLSSGGAPAKLNASFTATYTPHASIRNTSWIPISGATSVTDVLF